jgi:hypothetical protein
MDEGEEDHGLIYLSSHEIRSLQYVVNAYGRAVSLPNHEVLRRQESPSLGLLTESRRAFDHLLVTHSLNES